MILTWNPVSDGSLQPYFYLHPVVSNGPAKVVKSVARWNEMSLQNQTKMMMADNVEIMGPFNINLHFLDHDDPVVPVANLVLKDGRMEFSDTLDFTFVKRMRGKPREEPDMTMYALLETLLDLLVKKKSYNNIVKMLNISIILLDMHLEVSVFYFKYFQIAT